MTQHPAKSKPQIIIIGGGASGLAAACICARAGIPFLLLEKEARLGRKLLATGNGRCNLMNTGEPVFFGEEAFARQVLSVCGAAEVGEFFRKLGLTFFEEEAGRVYPLTRQAATVLDCLVSCIENSPGSRVKTDCPVQDITRTETGYKVLTEHGGEYYAPRVILSPGSPAAPKLGGSESLMQLLVKLGHSLVPFFPALSALETDTMEIKGMAGKRVPAWLTLLYGKDPVCASAGELLFTEYGLSGLCAMQLARDAHTGLAAGKKVSVSIDFSPLLGLIPPLMRRLDPGQREPGTAKQEVLELLKQREHTLGSDLVFTGLLPRQLAQKLKGQPLQSAANWLSGLLLPVKGIKGFDQAQVAAGGIACKDFNPFTMESKIMPGLYLCGEALNVDGDTGGFNLLFAWATGILAARHAVSVG